LQARLRGNRVEAAWVALPVGPFAALALGQKPEIPGRTDDPTNAIRSGRTERTFGLNRIPDLPGRVMRTERRTPCARLPDVDLKNGF
jgi:hypothetical protein